MSVRVGILGGSGYTGGELLRLLVAHPGAEVAWVSSRGRAGWPVTSVHPNLRSFTDLAFINPDDAEPCDVLFLCLPHGAAAGEIERYAALAHRVIDLSADFRLRDAAAYERTYGAAHPNPAWLDRFVYGLPEVSRKALRNARLASGVGCNATAVNLALLPLARAGLIERVVADLKVGSSEAGAEPSASGHHPERAGAVRTFAPTTHRHEAEIRQALGDAFALHFTATAVEMVRGVLATCHVFTTRELTDRDVWGLYRDAYENEPFVRIVKERRGLYRFPEPKIVAGTNFADVGFECQPGTNRVVALCAIDNLGKGAAGSAVQSMNLMCNLDETAALRTPGLHPV
ncbi:MAG: N-acetyl-gamma-glutamyl-phosphate reductase [Phycisphaerales bacterium]|nr:MAG: N-acetyl-gamma-glutamyl-phosphate reductase [Phycisphaerales bacterium]